jgi:hypothetical protein
MPATHCQGRAPSPARRAPTSSKNKKAATQIVLNSVHLSFIPIISTCYLSKLGKHFT